jgi:hypothetical protein
MQIHRPAIAAVTDFHEFAVPVNHWQMDLHADLRKHVAYNSAISRVLAMDGHNARFDELERSIFDAGEVLLKQRFAGER